MKMIFSYGWITDWAYQTQAQGMRGQEAKKRQNEQNRDAKGPKVDFKQDENQTQNSQRCQMTKIKFKITKNRHNMTKN